MADKTHLEMIKRGAEAWNRWRRGHPDVRPRLDLADLSGADLRGADLREADLSGTFLRGARLAGADLNRADLMGAHLANADLNGADLIGAYLIAVDLRGADLRGADLSGADLSGANLSGADFGGADLSETFLRGADLGGADISGAKVIGTTFANNDLRSVKGLEAVVHHGPSTVGVDTLFNSQGNIPPGFLRGAGLPEDFITYVPSLTGRAIEFYSCFISYSHADKSFARRLHDTLQGRGIRCWLDEHELYPGDKIYTEVDRGIRLWDKVLLCCSESSLTSWWVNHEIETAFDKEQQLWKERRTEVLALIPLDLDGYLLGGQCANGKATQIRTRVAADFAGWEGDNQKFEGQFERVVRALRTDEGGRRPPPKPRL